MYIGVFKKGKHFGTYYFENIIDSNACSLKKKCQERKTRRLAATTTEHGREEGGKNGLKKFCIIPDKGSKGN